MKITRLALTKRTVMAVLLILSLVAGVATYFTMPRQEDPGFTVRTAVVQTFYPGASPGEVERLVTDPLEEEIEEIPEIEFVESESRNGASVIQVEIQDRYSNIEEIWVDMRERVRAASTRLPQGIVGPIVNDNYGDRYSTVVAMTGEGFSYAELEKISEEIRKTLLGLENVGKVQIDGLPEKRIFVEYNRAQLAALGLSAGQLSRILRNRNVVAEGGFVQNDRERFEMMPSGSFETVDQIRQMTFRMPGSGDLVALQDIASVERGYADPPTQKVSYNGRRALAIGVSMAEGGKITQLGPRVLNALNEMEATLPAGLDFYTVSYRASVVDGLVSEFTASLVQGILAVLAVLLLFLGARTGAIVATAIPTTIIGSLIVMSALDVSLNKMSLTALIIALGLLVDNAVVISESILVQIREGKNAFNAAIDSVKELQFPLLVSSLTTASALLPTYISDYVVAEYTSAIFEVVTISLMLSWGVSVTFMPMMCYMFLKVKGETGAGSEDAAASTNGTQGPSAGASGHAAPGNATPAEDGQNSISPVDDEDTQWWNPATWSLFDDAASNAEPPTDESAREGSGEYDNAFYDWYRESLLSMVRNRWLALGTAVAILGAALWASGFLPEQFFPRKQETIFKAEVELPYGTPFERTEAVMSDLETFMRDSLKVAPPEGTNSLFMVPTIDETEFERQGILNWSAWIGSGAPRYILAYNPEQPRPNYAYMLVNTTSYGVQDDIIRRMNAFMDRTYPESTPRLEKLGNGPAVDYPVELRISGTNAQRLQEIADALMREMRRLEGVTHVNDNWGQQLKRIRVNIDDSKAQRAGLTNRDISTSLQASLSGVPLTNFREDNDLIPVKLQSDQAGDRRVESVRGIDVYSQTTGGNVPLMQVADMSLDFQYSRINRRNRQKTITVRCDIAPTAPKRVTPFSVVQHLRPWLNKQQADWPFGYSWEVGGEPEQSSGAQNGIRDKAPYAALLIILLLVAQFNSIRKPLIVLATLPFALVGVMGGLLLTRLPLDFMGLLGVIALFGIVINNAVVLIDRIEIEQEDYGRSPEEAVLEASQRRLRPILLTTATTIGGLVPLWVTGDVMFTPMAVSMIFGLLFATLLTLGLVPILYSMLYGLDFDDFALAAISGGGQSGGGQSGGGQSGDGGSGQDGAPSHDGPPPESVNSETASTKGERDG